MNEDNKYKQDAFNKVTRKTRAKKKVFQKFNKCFIFVSLNEMKMYENRIFKRDAFIKVTRETRATAVRLYFLIILILINGNINSQTFYKNSYYTIEKNKLVNNVLEEIGFYFYYIFENDGYQLKIEYYNNNQIKKVIGWSDSMSGVDYELDSNGSLLRLQYIILGREAGPLIEFFTNRLIKSYYNYGYKNTDLFLPLITERFSNQIENGLMKFETEKSYYKKKNGIEYHFNEKGALIKKVHFKENVIVNTEEVKYPLSSSYE